MAGWLQLHVARRRRLARTLAFSEDGEVVELRILPEMIVDQIPSENHGVAALTPKDALPESPTLRAALPPPLADCFGPAPPPREVEPPEGLQ